MCLARWNIARKASVLELPTGKTLAIRLASAGPASRCVTVSTTRDILGNVLTRPAQVGPATRCTNQRTSENVTGIALRTNNEWTSDSDAPVWSPSGIGSRRAHDAAETMVTIASPTRASAPPRAGSRGWRPQRDNHQRLPPGQPAGVGHG